MVTKRHDEACVFVAKIADLYYQQTKQRQEAMELETELLDVLSNYFEKEVKADV